MEEPEVCIWKRVGDHVEVMDRLPGDSEVELVNISIAGDRLVVTRQWNGIDIYDLSSLWSEVKDWDKLGYGQR